MTSLSEELGVLGTDEKKILGLISRKRHPAKDGSVEKDVRDRLRAAVLDDDPRGDRCGHHVVGGSVQRSKLLRQLLTKALVRAQ